MQRFGDPAIYESNFIPVGMRGGCCHGVPQGFTDPANRSDILHERREPKWMNQVKAADCPLLNFKLAPVYFTSDGKKKIEGRLVAISRSGKWWVVWHEDGDRAVFEDGEFQRLISGESPYLLCGISDSGVTFGYLAEGRSRIPVWEAGGKITAFRHRGLNMLMPLQMASADGAPGLTLGIGSASGNIQFYRIENADAEPVAITEHSIEQIGEIPGLGTYEHIINLNGLGVFKPTTPYMPKTPLAVTRENVAPPPVLKDAAGALYDIDELNQVVGVVDSWPVLVNLDKEIVTALPSPGCSAATAVSSDGRFIAGTPGAHAQGNGYEGSERSLILWRDGKPFRIEPEGMEFLEPQVITLAGTLVVHADGDLDGQYVRHNVLLCPEWPEQVAGLSL